jgi:hypothetical protein
MTTDSHTPRESAGGDGLLFFIAMAVVAVVAVEGLLIAFSSWWLMGLTVLLVIAAAAAVCGALVHLMNDDTPVPVPRRAPEPKTAAATVPALVSREAWSAPTRHARIHPS